MIAFKLTGLYLRWSDKGTAFRWALHTHADDMLGEHPAGGGAGKQQLRTVFDMNESALEELERIAAECLREVKQDGDGDWS